MDPQILQLKAEIRELQQRVARLERARRRWIGYGVAIVVLAIGATWLGLWLTRS